MDPLSRHLFRGAGSRGPLVLMYHSIAQPGAPVDWPWQVAYEAFVAQLELLVGSGWRTATLAEIARQPDQPKTAVISFDDGYADNLAAVNALVARGLRGAWFIVAGHVGGVADWPASERPAFAMLSAPQLRAMREAGMEIGSHTEHHADLSRCEGPELQHEVVDSRRRLEDLLGARIDSFAYPYGRLNAKAVAAVAQAGYAAACTTASGWALLDRDPLRIRRLTVSAGDSLSCFARKLAFADNEGGWSRVARYGVGRVRSAFGEIRCR